MGVAIAARLSAIKPSATIAVSMKAADLKAAGRDIIALGAGEPDFDTPDHIKQAALEAISAGQTKYTAVDGTLALKEAILRKYRRDNDLSYEPAQVIVSNGAKHSIFNLLLAILDAGDEVLVPAPYWVSYPDMVALAGGTPRIVGTTAETAFRVTPAQLEAAITPATKLLILNAPSNPTGQVYREEDLAGLAEVLRRHPQVMVVSDDIYELIYWGVAPLRNLLEVAPDLADRTVLVNGVSKAYAMTGWRIGYAVGPAAVIAAMRKVQSQSTSNPCSISQAASAAALDGDHGPVSAMGAAFKERHDYVVGALNGIEGIRCLPADGAFYAFASFEGLLARRPEFPDDVALAGALLEGAGVAMVPGTAFGMPGHLRLSYATSMAQLEAAMARLGEFAAGG
ncbi:MAG: pyridoxal phosphate-dependent aminotransferase [Pseudomonadota bacterium]